MPKDTGLSVTDSINEGVDDVANVPHTPDESDLGLKLINEFKQYLLCIWSGEPFCTCPNTGNSNGKPVNLPA